MPKYVKLAKNLSASFSAMTLAAINPLVIIAGGPLAAISKCSKAAQRYQTPHVIALLPIGIFRGSLARWNHEPRDCRLLWDLLLESSWEEVSLGSALTELQNRYGAG